MQIAEMLRQKFLKLYFIYSPRQLHFQKLNYAKQTVFFEVEV
jgi:hypothetical protein